MNAKATDKLFDIRIGEKLINFSFRGVSRISVLISNKVSKTLIPFAEISGLAVNLDLSGINFIDSSGFNTLLAVLNTSKEHGAEFKLSNINDEINELISVVKLNQTFSRAPELL